MEIIKGAEEYFLQGSNNKGVLLIHGYTGTPAELRLLGDHLHDEGYTVLGVRLPGHGTTVQDLNETQWPCWYDAARIGCERLLKCTDTVMVAGLSMGGLLAMKAAAELPVAKAVFLAAPIYVQDRRVPFLPLLKYFIRYVKKSKRSYFSADKYNLSYDVMPVKPLTSLFKLVKECKERLLPSITIPCLIVQSRAEHTVAPKSAQYIYDHLGSRDKKLLWLNNSSHIVTLDCERETVFEEISRFFAK